MSTGDSKKFRRSVVGRGAALVETALLVALLAVIAVPAVQKFGIRLRAPFCAYINYNYISPERPPSYFIEADGERCRRGSGMGAAGYYW